MNNHQRKLLIVPILHTKEDMGSLGTHLTLADGYTAMISDFWQEVKERVKRYVHGAAHDIKERLPATIQIEIL